MTFREEVIYLTGEHSRDSFPVRFSNEVYHSRVPRLVKVGYQSNFTIKYCTMGTEKYLVNGEPVAVPPNHYVILNEGNQVVTNTKEASEGISLFLDYDVINDTFSNLQNGERKLLDDPHYMGSDVEFFEHVYSDTDQLGDFLRRFHSQSCSSFGSGSMNLSPLFYYHLAYHLITSQYQVFRKMNEIQKAKKATTQEIMRRILTAKSYIEENHDRNFDLEEVARIACMSKFHFLRSFNDVFNHTPFAYHQHIRMRAANRMLRNRQGNITEVSEALGFSSLSTFSKSFKKHFGFTPSEALSR